MPDVLVVLGNRAVTAEQAGLGNVDDALFAPAQRVAGVVAQGLTLAHHIGVEVGQRLEPVLPDQLVVQAAQVFLMLSVWLYYNFCGWLNILNCTLPPVGIILVISYFMNKKAYDTDTIKIVTVNWFAVAGVILGAIVANVVTWGIASINGMVVAALCYVIGEIYKREK